MRRRLTVLLLLSLLTAPARGQSVPQLTQSTIAGGGGASAQGPVRVEGTIGQSAVGASSGGAFTLAGGFQPVVAALAQPALSVSDVARAEGNAGTSTFTFTVSLSFGPQSPVTFDIATQDGTAAAGEDYEVKSLTGQTINAGQTAYQFEVAVGGDGAQESDETFFVNVTNVSGAVVSDAQAVGTILNDDGAPSAGQVVISEFRLRGPVPAAAPAAGNEQGQLDEFIELYNNTDAEIVVADSAPAGLGADGWAIFSSDDQSKPKYVVPAGARIPARGYFLVTNAQGYSLSAYAAADTPGGTPASYSADIPDGAGLALFRTGSPAVTSADDVLDRVGFAPEVPAGNAPSVAAVPLDFFEGTPLQPAGGVTTPAEHSFVRRLASGRPADTQENASDFVFVSTDAGNYDGAQSTLGAPGPQNSVSPVQRNAGIKSSLLDSTVSSQSPPNSVRRQDCPPAGAAAPGATAEECDPARSKFGTFSIRRRWTNKTGAKVTRLRFRIVNVTTGPTPAPGTADLRAITSQQVAEGAITIEGTTLEEVSNVTPSQPAGGGLNSTLAVGTIDLGLDPLVPDESINLQFLLGVQQPGAYAFFVNVEAVTEAVPGSPAQSKSGAAQQPKSRSRGR